MAQKILNETGLNYYHNRIKALFAGKSEFDTLSSQVQGIVSTGGEANKIDEIKINNTSLAITNKSVNIDLSPYQLSANAITSNDVDTKISTALSNISGVRFEIISTLPTSGEDGIFYLLPLNSQGQNKNIYEEYVWVNKGTSSNPDYVFELLGTTQVDLSEYLQTSDIVALTTAEIDTILGS